jgi:tRNA (guanine37-N1)-methyltransferase
MKYDILTLFPAMFDGPLSQSILRRAAERGLIEVRCHAIRDYAYDRHRTTDDYPYGGGAGMVMKVEPLTACLEHVLTDRPRARIILTSPRGRRFDQSLAAELAADEELVIVCGRYEGVDERLKELFPLEEISIGDFVLTGGEPAALVIVDAVSRLLPGVLGCGESAENESFADGLLEYPQYTRPETFRGHGVPEMLLSGNHGEVRKWRRREALRRTLQMRPDLLETAPLDESDRDWLRRISVEPAT